jgi:hypothetical protein
LESIVPIPALSGLATGKNPESERASAELSPAEMCKSFRFLHLIVFSWVRLLRWRAQNCDIWTMIRLRYKHFLRLFHGVCIISEREPEREKRANELAGVCIAWEKKNKPAAGAFISPDKPTLQSFYTKKN